MNKPSRGVGQSGKALLFLLFKRVVKFLFYEQDIARCGERQSSFILCFRFLNQIQDRLHPDRPASRFAPGLSVSSALLWAASRGNLTSGYSVLHLKPKTLRNHHHGYLLCRRLSVQNGRVKLRAIWHVKNALMSGFFTYRFFPPRYCFRQPLSSSLPRTEPRTARWQTGGDANQHPRTWPPCEPRSPHPPARGAPHPHNRYHR